MRLFVAGNSHVGALAAAPVPAGLELTVFPFGNGRHETQAFSRTTAAGVELLPEQYAANLRRFAARDAIAADPAERWGLLVVNHNARLYRDAGWLTHEPAEICSPGRAPVTRGVLDALVARDQAGVRLLLEQVQAAGVDLFAISAPWPRRDHPAIRRGIRPEVVAHVDRVARSTWAAWLTARGIPLVDTPVEAGDADGFLLPAYAADEVRPGVKDPHHANAAYGALVLEALAGLATG